MLEPSRLSTFIDQNNGFTLHYFEGQSVIKDLALIHNIQGEGFHFFRDAVLTFLPMITFLKSGESFGFYIDSNEPWFRFKLEANTLGYMRTLILPEQFNAFPSAITGLCRLSKVLPGQREAYNTVVELENLSVREISNKILKDSYQVNAKVYLSQKSDQALLFQRLPDKQIDKVGVDERPSLEKFMQQEITAASEMLETGDVNYQKICQHFEARDMMLLNSTEITFKCACSRERMVQGVASLARSESMDDIFLGKESIEAKCDYCKTFYEIKREEVVNSLTQ